MAISDQPTFCTNCVSMSTRPRITFDERGWCNACVWMEEKKSLDWDQRQEELKHLLSRHRGDRSSFNCLVPVSGGKDGSYVAHMLKNKYSMRPLCVTVTPPLELPLGERNLKNFISSGYDHISITPNPDAMRTLCTVGFQELGFPYYGWLVAIQSAVVGIALQLGIGLIFYGEDGEVEYGGTHQTKHQPIYDVSYMKEIYLEGGYEQVMRRTNVPLAKLNFFRFPTDTELSATSPEITHWSYFENWDPYRNYLVAKEFCGLEEANEPNVGTFTNFAQNDQALYALHTYLMYLKFGFGRANQDACIEVRRGAMDRDQAVNLVRLYDGVFPHKFLELYLDYFQMSRGEFDSVLDRWANKELFRKVNGAWSPTFEIQ